MCIPKMDVVGSSLMNLKNQLIPTPLNVMPNLCFCSLSRIIPLALEIITNTLM